MRGQSVSTPGPHSRSETAATERRTEIKDGTNATTDVLPAQRRGYISGGLVVVVTEVSRRHSSWIRVYEVVTKTRCMNTE